jgi:hypothetical protein
VVLFARVHSGMSSEVAAGGERAIASGTNMLLLGDRILNDRDYLLRVHVGRSALGLGVGSSVLIVRVIIGVVIFRSRLSRHA